MGGRAQRLPPNALSGGLTCVSWSRASSSPMILVVSDCISAGVFAAELFFCFCCSSPCFFNLFVSSFSCCFILSSFFISPCFFISLFPPFLLSSFLISSCLLVSSSLRFAVCFISSLLRFSFFLHFFISSSLRFFISSFPHFLYFFGSS